MNSKPHYSITTATPPIYEMMEKYAIHPDDISRKANCSLDTVHAALDLTDFQYHPLIEVLRVRAAIEIALLKAGCEVSSATLWIDYDSKIRPLLNEGNRGKLFA